MLDLKMKESCRICGRDLCGNQRRWIFHPTAKLNLQVLLSHALGQELTRDGRGEFACSKCTFMLDRMYRFDTVIARVEALSIERLQRLLQEKHRLRQCIGGLYRKTNSEDGNETSVEKHGSAEGMVDISGLTHAKYCALLQEDLVYSLYESWADDSLDGQHQHQCSEGPPSEVPGFQRCTPSTPRRCRGCSHWRVADSDYEAVCKVPRKLARSFSCGPSTRYSASVTGVSATGAGKDADETDELPSSLTLVPGSHDPSRTSDSDPTLAGRASSSPSFASLETGEDDTQPGAVTYGSHSSPKELIYERISDSFPEEHMMAPHDPESPAPNMALALFMLQNYSVYRPIQNTKGSKLPVLHRQKNSNGGTRTGFPDPLLAMSFASERDHNMPTTEFDTPVIRLDDDVQHGLRTFANMEDCLEDSYIECPRPPPHKNLVEEQQSQLNQYECAAGQCVNELQKAQLQVQTLQAKIHESEANNMKLQEKLNEMESELRLLRHATQSRDRTIQGLTESMGTKDSEAQELYQMIEGQNSTLCKLQEIVHRNQLAQRKVPEGVCETLTLAKLQEELVGVQSSLFSLGLELEVSQRSLRRSQRQEEDLVRFKDRLNADLQEALQHKELTEKHNQDLRCALQKSHAELQAKEAALKESEAERATVLQESNGSISRLKQALQQRDRQLQDYIEMSEAEGKSKPRDALQDKLRERIKDRDKALERSIDDKFRCMDEHENQVRMLQLALREKERDLERLRCILSNNGETITSLDALVRGKELEVEQAAEAYRNLQWLKQQSDEKERNTLLEKDGTIRQLQAALQARSRETQDLTAALVARVQAGPSEVVEELKARLELKEKLFQELLSDRSRRSNEHQTEVQDLLNTISSKDQYLQDTSYRLSMVISERSSELQELRQQLLLKEQELCQLRRDREREFGGDTERLQGLLKEKEAFIKDNMQTGEEVSSKEGTSEFQVLQDELQLALRKEREAQKELSALRSSYIDSKDGTGHKHVLEQLVSEYHKLNEALRAEKRLYQSLAHSNARSDSSAEKLQSLHTELDTVQALRGQLEEVLARTRDMALTMDRASKMQPDFGGLSTEDEEEEGDDEEGSSDEFTDSIEEEEVEEEEVEKVSARSSSSIRRSESHVTRQTLECELEEVKAELQRDGFTSVAQMRSALQKLQLENQSLKEGRTGNHRGFSPEVEEDIYEEEVDERSSVRQRGLDCSSPDEEQGMKRRPRPSTLDLPHHPLLPDTEVDSSAHSCEVATIQNDYSLRSDLALSLQENRELQERLMVSEATVQAQAEQLKDYRDLLTETSVQQASKQVQVDLQDLGYETCGRSENEAEREDASSPEFDDLEMCTSLSVPQDYEGPGGGWYSGHSRSHKVEMGDHLVQDLRSQLSRCHKVIRGLQLKVRSLSATSDYASSLERTPRKVNWAFERSSGAEDDEGWMSDNQSGAKRSRELQELMARVTSLEAQLRSTKMEGKDQAEDGKCATWPGKYNSLIQSQARELSNLRQKMREGRGVSHILTQHLGDTTKAFEELLRANDIDYYMGQSFREQLAQGSALAQRLVTKISGRGRAESHDDSTDHELLAMRLSKELQQKDKIIESLHNKLQHRPETPSSCQALSETTEQSDRTSLVSDEYRTTEDLELCSDLDSREYQEEPQLEPGADVSASIPPPRPPLKSSNSCPNMQTSSQISPSFRAPFSLPPCSPSVPCGPDALRGGGTFAPRPRALTVIAVRPELDSLYKRMNEQNRDFALPHGNPAYPLSPGAHNQHDLSGYNQLPHHAFQPYQLSDIPEDFSLKSDSGLVTGGTLWDNVGQKFGSYASSPAHQSANGHSGVNLIEEHLQEVRCLRQRLEESIRTNERLRQQLEERLACSGHDRGAPTNIYIQGLDSVTQLSNEIRALKEENVNLQSRLKSSSDSCEEVVQLREAVISARSGLKQAELEAERWKEELHRLQASSQEQAQQMVTFRQERQASQEKINRLQHDVSLLQQQLCESREFVHSLQSELQVYDRVCPSIKSSKGFLSEVPGLPVELGELLGEVRSLRAQLQTSVQDNSALKQLELRLGAASPRRPSLSALSASPQRENFYRRQLLHDPAPSPPVRDIGLFNCGSPGPPYSDLDDAHSTANDPLDPHSELEGEAPDGSFANRNGRHAIGHVDDFSALQQQILEGRSLVQCMETTLQSYVVPPLPENNQDPTNEMILDSSCVKALLSNTKTLRQIMEEALALLKMFWRAALPSSDHPSLNLKKEQSLQEEILSLKLRMSEQDEVLRGTIQRLRSTSRTKENMEHFIVNQLSRTRDVLKKARTNLEKNEQRLSSLSSSSSSPGQESGGAARDRPADSRFLKTSGVAPRPANRKRSSQCLL
ncbi:myomegalin-like isoform 2-T2 [Synchiropus picturatus]